jgi:signal transduction histidine kinase
MSLRARTILAAATATLVAVIVLGLAVDILVARDLRNGLDHNLRTRAAETAQLAASAPALLTTPGALDSPVGATQAMVEVVDKQGRIVARSLSLGGRVLPRELAASAIADGRGGYRTVSFDDRSLRVYVAPLGSFSGPASGGAVIVAAATADVSETISTLHALTFGAALTAALVGALAVALLMRGALRPLVRLSRGAGEIERTGDPSLRLPQPARDDEVGKLATTLNAMLDSLERARESERRFLADASHELRTPLTALRGNVAHLARHGSSPDLIADLEADAERIARLADDLLALSREESGTGVHEQEVDLGTLAKAVAAPGIDIDIDIDTEPVTVVGDQAALERALGNLVENARRYGPAGGRIRVKARQENGLALLEVEDDGLGPAHGDERLVFERFWRGRQDGRGSGLGLAIVKATAERHGGRALVIGSRFTIELPALRKASENEGTVVEESYQKG